MWVELAVVGSVGESVAYPVYRRVDRPYLGLELGAMSHSLSDWGGSAYKRFQSRVCCPWQNEET